MSKNTPTLPRGHRHRWWALALLALPTFVIALDMNALMLALPKLSTDLGATATEQLWITDIYGFVLAGLLVTMGSLGDRIGRRRLLLLGGAGFAVASAVAAFSTSAPMLIGARVAMGVTAATLMPSTLALISNMFEDDAERGKAIGVWATSMFAGGALGPVVTGLLLSEFWWGSVLLLNVPVMGALLVIGRRLLPEYRGATAGRIDPLSVALSLGAVFGVVYGLKRLAVDGVADPAAPVAAIAAGLILGTLFVRRQLGLAEPLLQLRLFRERTFSATLATLTVAGSAMAGTGLLVTQYLQNVLDQTPAASGLLFAPMGLGVALGTTVAPRVGARVGAGPAIAGGLCLSGLGFTLLALVPSGGGLPLVLASIVTIAVGTGPLFALGTGLVVSSVPREQAGSAASMSETSNALGGNLGIALFGSLSAAIYHAQVAGSLPGGLTGAARDAAGDSLVGAVGTAGSLPGREAGQLLDAAHGAFTSGVHVLGLAGAGMFAALALMIAVAFRPAVGTAPAEADATA